MKKQTKARLQEIAALAAQRAMEANGGPIDPQELHERIAEAREEWRSLDETARVNFLACIAWAKGVSKEPEAET